MKDLCKRSRSRSNDTFMTAIQTLIISLAKNFLNSVIDYILYLDNFFNNIFLATALRKLDIKIMSTAQIDALDFSLSLVQLKHAKRCLE